jgi:hypothetical protein
LLGAVVLAVSAGSAMAASFTTSGIPSDVKNKAAAECQHSRGRYIPAADVCELPGQ